MDLDFLGIGFDSDISGLHYASECVGSRFVLFIVTHIGFKASVSLFVRTSN